MSYLDSSWTQLGATFDGSLAGDQAGNSVAINADGTIMAFSAHNNDDGGSNRGTISVYQYNSANDIWSKLGSDIYGVNDSDYSGGGTIGTSESVSHNSVKLSADGYTIAIGSCQHNSRGQVRVFTYQDGNWSQLGSNINSNINFDYFGYSLALSNNGRTLAVGAPQRVMDQGRIIVYKYDNVNGWVQMGTTLIGNSGNQFGISVSLNNDGTILACGANSYIRIFKFLDNSWNLLGSQIPIGCTSISLNNIGDIIAIGSPNSNSFTGLIRIYKYINNSWTQFGQTINGLNNYDMFGNSVSLNTSGNIVTVGAPRYNRADLSISPGYVVSYKYFAGSWKQLGKQISVDISRSLCGYSVSSSDTGLIIAVGSMGVNSSTTLKGNVKVYKYIPPETPFSNVCFPEGTLITTDQGQVPIEQINPSKHTIRKQEIVGITKTISQDKYLVCIEKDALAKNIPSKTTYISKLHTLFYNGEMVQSKDLVGRLQNVYKVDYDGEILYNVLLKNHDKMIVNNLICETLNPKNGTAKMYMFFKENNVSFEEQKKCIKEYNDYTIKNKVVFK
jgi:hypothetical protein